jgi:4-diphosphocytidyl-2-C-methyl-D-erythritol kinase
MIQEVITIKAPAKINLGLEVLGKRKDGYHELSSVITTIGLFDTVKLKIKFLPAGSATSIKIYSKAKDLPLGNENNAYRAAEIFLKKVSPKFKKPFLLEITIKKRIPLAGGLGGSGTDAAAVILGLNRLLGLKLSLKTLKEIALKVGSEVPFFILGGVSLIAGRGERVKNISLEPLKVPLLLIFKNEPWLTADSFLGMGPFLKNKIKSGAVLKVATKIRKGEPAVSWIPFLVNNLEHSLRTDKKYLFSTKQSLKESGALVALLSGSGSTIYGIYPDNYTLGVAAKKLSQDYFLVKIPA